MANKLTGDNVTSERRALTISDDEYSQIRALVTSPRELLVEYLAKSLAEINRLRAELATRPASDAQQRIVELEEALAMATGPHCSSCGNSIDPDCCWCGSTNCNTAYDGHAFCPMGCVCGFGAPKTNEEWAARMSALREQLWRERRKSTDLINARNGGA